MMEDLPEIPIFDSLGAVENLYNARHKFRFSFLWGILASLFFIMIFILFALYLALGITYDRILIYMLTGLSIGIGFPLIVMTLWFLPYSVMSHKAIERFLLEFKPIWMTMRIELLPAVGTDTKQRLTSKMKELDLRLKKSTTIEKTKFSYLATDYNFEVLIRNGRNVGVGKLFNNVNIDLETIKETNQNAVGLAKNANLNVVLLLISSRSGYSSEAIKWVESGAAVGKGIESCALLTVTNETFKVNAISVR